MSDRVTTILTSHERIADSGSVTTFHEVSGSVPGLLSINADDRTVGLIRVSAEGAVTALYSVKGRLHHTLGALKPDGTPRPYVTDLGRFDQPDRAGHEHTTAAVDAAHNAIDDLWSRDRHGEAPGA